MIGYGRNEKERESERKEREKSVGGLERNSVGEIAGWFGVFVRSRVNNDENYCEINYPVKNSVARKK